MRITLLLAADSNGVIGLDDKLPWRLPSDLAHFKQVTKGGIVVMGRKTYESLPNTLPGRRKIVLTHSPTKFAQCSAKDGDVYSTANTVAEAIGRARLMTCDSRYPGTSDLKAVITRMQASRGDVGELFVIGGAEIYKQFLPVANRVLLTEVLTESEGNVRVDWLDQLKNTDNWFERTYQPLTQGSGDEFPFSIKEYEREQF